MLFIVNLKVLSNIVCLKILMYFGKCLRIKYVNFRMRDIELKEILKDDIFL